jgi:DNA repair exonuclease SbcCD ATPase subunit
MPTEVVAPDSTAAPSTAPVPEVVEDDFAVPEDVKDEKSKARFQKLVDRAKAAEEKVGKYSDLGDPEQISEFVQYARHLEGTLEQTQARIKELEERREPGEPKTKEQQDLEASRSTIRKQLREHEPLLDELEADLKERKAEKQARIQALTLDAVDATADVMKEYGMPTSREKVQDMCDTLEPIIKKHPRLRFRFDRDPGAAIKAAMGIYLENAKTVLENKSRLDSQRTKMSTAALPRAHGGGGGPGTTKPSEPAKNIADGMARAMAKWRERGT